MPLSERIAQSSRLLPEKCGFVIFAHGSRIESANEGVREIAVAFACAGSYPQVETAFLELGQPDLAGAVARLATEGARHIVVIPYFLTLGIHLERDLPALVAKLMGAHPGIEIRVTKPLEGHPDLVRILLDRAGEALIS
jgi:sirohydrochlorin ferrochelatase